MHNRQVEVDLIKDEWQQHKPVSELKFHKIDHDDGDDIASHRYGSRSLPGSFYIERQWVTVEDFAYAAYGQDQKA